jgi:hypothetical protein
MGIKGVFKRIFRGKPRTKKLTYTITFKTELEDTRDGRMILLSEPLVIDQNTCYGFRNMLNNKCESVTFLDQYDKVTIKTYPCAAQTSDHVVFINNPIERTEYGKIIFIIPKIETIGDHHLKVVAEVGDFNRCLTGSYRDFALRGQTVTFTIKYRPIKENH